MAARAIAAFLFVAVFGWVLAQPILDSMDAPAPGRASTPGPRTEPDRGDDEDFAGKEEDAARQETVKRLAGRFPRVCLRPVAPVADGGMVAAYRDRIITVVTTSGEVVGRITDVAPTVRPPLQWSPSGRYLAAGPQGLFWKPNGERVLFSNGEFSHGAVSMVVRGRWGWSPIADCTVSIERGVLYAASVDPSITGAGVELVREGVESFSFSPDGSKLGLVVKDGNERSISIADLVKNRMREVLDLGPGCCTTIAGWSPDGRRLLYWAGAGPSTMFDGTRLRAIDPRGDLASFGGTYLYWRTSAISCDDRFLGIVGGGRDVTKNKRLAFIEIGRKPTYITAREESYLDASCAPGGDLIAAVTGPSIDYFGKIRRAALYERRIEILRHDGSVVTTIAASVGQGADAPEWGPPGLLFVRFATSSASLWFAREGESPAPLGIPVAKGGFTYGHFSWDRFIDWSATPPTGLPAG